MTKSIAGVPLVRELPANLHLAHGKHETPEAGMCVMEAVAFIVGGKWTDAPACVSPVIRRFAIGLNDRWSDVERQQLVPFITKVIGTTNNAADEQTRRYLALDWAYRIALPAALRYGKLVEHAERLEALAPIVDRATANAGWSVMNSIAAATRERREAARAELRKQFGVAAAVAAEVAAAAAAAEAVAAEVAAAAAAAEAAAVAVAAEVAAAAEISKALAGVASESSWATPIAAVIKQELKGLPKTASYYGVHQAIYWPVRRKMAELFAGGLLGPEYMAYRQSMQRGALELLERMIAVGKKAVAA